MKVSCQFRQEFVQTYLALKFPTLQYQVGSRVWFLGVSAFARISKEVSRTVRNKLRDAILEEMKGLIKDADEADHLINLLISCQDEFDSLTVNAEMQDVMFWIRQNSK